jgi:PLD-like domain
MRYFLALSIALAVAGGATEASAASPAITYRTLFQDPGAVPAPDLSLERHAIALIGATPAGERITFAFRDFNRRPVADALVAAHQRGVLIDGVIDGGERTRTIVQSLHATLGASRVVLCGSPAFVFNSCIANSLVPSLQHNKFMTFSRLVDGRENIVLQTSKNFLEPSQLNYYNDMVEIAGDAALYDAYVEYIHDMKAQVRADDRYLIRSGDDGRNTIFPSPRRQSDLETDDIIVDRMNEIDCSKGGSVAGTGLIRIANMAFRSERAVIMRKLVRLAHAGCDVEVIVSNADGDILAGLVSAGIPVHPLFLRNAAPRPQVTVHNKYWLVDAGSTLTGERTKIAYVGSSNWRGDQQYSDDLLLRIVDGGVHAAYSAYWELQRSRAASDQNRPAADAVVPSSALTATPAATWSRSDVLLRVAASDGHNVQAVGLERLHVELSGAQTGSWDFTGETNGYSVGELAVTAEGETTITYFAEDRSGNIEPARSAVVRVDKTAPTLAGLPRDCVLWPPNRKLVHVADISASDHLSGLDDLVVSASSSDAPDDEGDIVIKGGSVFLRAERPAGRRSRVYRIVATATDAAGNSRTESARCVVPHPGARRRYRVGPSSSSRRVTAPRSSASRASVARF